MGTEKLLNKFSVQKIVLISEPDFRNILKNSKIKLEKDTLVSGKIRILELNNHTLFQETTKNNEIAVRKFRSFKQAEKLVEERMSVYENMWNGCGCKVNYYE